MPTSFQRMQEQTQKLIKSLVDMSGLDENLVSNLIVYAKQLPKSDAPNEIDELVFVSQMLKQFNFTSPSMVSLMFGAIRSSKSSFATIEEFCKLLIVFMCSNLDLKIQFVFKVYDLNGDGELSFSELYHFLRPCVIMNDSEDVDTEEAVRELVEIVLKVTDIDENGAIDLNEFRRLVKSNVLYLQLLGPCLPTESYLQHFQHVLSTHNESEIRQIFGHERQFAMEKDTKLKYYPIRLELP
ncbi:calaxin-like isoform X1 [Biomphalaria glabrata]|uniref:Calaxin-like isoform X1 n=2 Tax=Biomphalaria glabrata TaxID=6526 RepID=A0A9W2ZFM8_BIOGL|nr:calaxin-like isoform X1 [Biomphalaria glabrata]KAI8752110.1 EF-hand calcium-binding domain-containing protein 1-like isoform X1 [Biomphalaria glabrata]KAI8785809.1 EF-hand calcium-binding domain-containing protein 1 isoform X1 [Biomphalaria glabrata]